MNSLSAANIKFCFDIFKELKKNEKGNVFYSPLSISAAMGMLLLGLGGNTASQVKKVLHYDEVAKMKRPSVKESPSTSPGAACDKHGEFHSQFHALLEEINEPNDDYSLAIANSLFGNPKFPFLQSYLDCVENLYQASPESMDFSQAPEESREKINSWVEDRTNGKIKELFPPGTIDASTILVLVNAIYFKGKWAMEFKRESTKKELFMTNKDTSKSVQMMKQKDFFNIGYIQECQGKIIELPYTNNHLSMFVLLPTETDGLEKLEEELTSEKLMEWINPENMTKKEVFLSFPRFKLEQTYSLGSTLEAMGMRDIFDAQSADFSGMTTHKGLSVSKILHKSFVEVNEEGTEAAAATGIAVGLSASLAEEFNCNQPFLFFIRDNRSENILFYGRVIDP
ncbi:serpin B4-like [Gracilinanus agilis]|uniref:serpin B4-like n=1 Tax=Gracilinanus agilis TaxID=191870 RepID=UPI001CFF1EB9|nr:serpin B4-like [Gracilinanus agilis]